MEFITEKLEDTALSTESTSAASTSTVPKQTYRVVSSESFEIDDIIRTLKQAPLLALDCEGVDLGRAGKICLVQLATREHCFLFDVHDVQRSHKMVLFIRHILSDHKVTKIIHDVRQDSDALFHHLGIRLQNIHDTQRWDYVLNATERNLNKTLEAYGLVTNAVRDCSVYDQNAAFWAQRPLTDTMIEWACGDVQTLFDLYHLQTERATVEQRAFATAASLTASVEIVAMVSHVMYINPAKMGKFIGKGGANVMALKEKHLGSHFKTGHTPGEVVVYARDNIVLNAVLKDMKKFVN